MTNEKPLPKRTVLSLICLGCIAVFMMQQQPTTSLRRLDLVPMEDDTQQDTEQYLSMLIDADDDNDDTTTNEPTRKVETGMAICNMLQNESPIAIWTKHLAEIFQASRHTKLDQPYQLHDSTAEVLELITPRLRLAAKNHIRDWKVVETVILKAERRIQYLLKKKEEETSGKEGDEVPPVKIVVFGGSVTMGIACDGGRRRYSGFECSWVKRLELLINQLAQMKVVEVHNMAIGGTNTGNVNVLLKYEILPKAALSPDIVINAYSTNDMHITSVLKAAKLGRTLEQNVFEMAQGFIRQVFSTCSSTKGLDTPPLLIWLDDYLGNEQRGIFETSAVSRAIQVLAGYYGFGFVSYADTVRDLVYGSTNETFFSPAGWYKRGLHKPMTREIHPGRSMHIVQATL